MKGFAEKCLVILPKDETVSDMSEDAERLLYASISSLLKFLDELEIQACFFNTDAVAVYYNQQKPIKFLSALTPEDNFYAKRNFTDVVFKCMENEESIYEKARVKYPLKKTETPEERLIEVEKREKFIKHETIKNEKFIVDFSQKNNPQVKITPKEGDGKFIFKVSLMNYTVTATVNGVPVDITYIIKDFNALKPLYEWRE